MNRNTPTFNRDQTAINISRSKKNLSHGHKSAFKAGYLYPIYSNCDIMPGDTIKMDLTSLIRMATPIAPVMDDCYMDVYCFFIPHKLSLRRYTMPYDTESYDWKYFLGAQDFFLNMPLPSGLPQLPGLHWAGEDNAFPDNCFYDHLGISLSGSNQRNSNDIHALDYMAYCLVWNDFFRDENTEQPMAFGFSDDLITGAYTTFYGGPYNAAGVDYMTLSIAGHDILPVCRPHGYFGSALPWPQRNLSGVTIPLLGNAVVGADGGLRFTGNLGGVTDTGSGYLLADASGAVTPGTVVNMKFANDTSGAINYGEMTYASGLKVDLSNVSSVTVNQFRALVAKQHFLEALARGGNRLGEMSSALFGVRPHDSGDDHAEYLGGKRIPIIMSEIAQTAPSSTSGTSDTNSKGLGNLGAYSKTLDRSYMFEKSFDTWGTLAVYVCFRTNETFHQGIPRRLTRKTRDDFYFPAFARIGDQPVLNKEIYWSDDSHVDEVYGYMPAWAEYMYEPDTVSSVLRPGKSLGYFTFANNFGSLPTLAGYVKGGAGITANVDRVLQVASSTSGFQFLGDFFFKIDAIRAMPADTRPGLVRI